MAIERIQVRRDTAIRWTNANPILASGELALETDTRNLKVGTGVTNWVTLPYLSAGGGGGGGVTTFAGRAGAVVATIDDITDATVTGKAVVRAATQAAARTAIGAQQVGSYALVSEVTTAQTTANNAQISINNFSATKGAVSGLASLDAGGKVPAVQLPSYVDDVLEFGSAASFPATGEIGKIFLALDTGLISRWSGTVYVVISPSPGSTDAVPEGTTNLYFSNARAQSANVTALALKAPLASPVFSGTVSVPDASFTIIKTSGLQAALDGKQASGSYAAAVHTHTAAQVSDSTVVGRSVLTAVDAAAARLAIGAASSSGTVTFGTTAGTAAEGNDARLSDARTPLAHTHTATAISDSTVVGRSVIVAIDAAAARTAIGAGTGNGTSSLVLGTTNTTAKAGDYAPTLADLPAGSTVMVAGATRTSTRTDLRYIFVNAADVPIVTSPSLAGMYNGDIQIKTA